MTKNHFCKNDLIHLINFISKTNLITLLVKETSTVHIYVYIIITFIVISVDKLIMTKLKLNEFHNTSCGKN